MEGYYWNLKNLLDVLTILLVSKATPMIDQVKNHYEVHIIIFDGFNNYLIKEAVESDEDSVKLEEVEAKNLGNMEIMEQTVRIMD